MSAPVFSESSTALQLSQMRLRDLAARAREFYPDRSALGHKGAGNAGRPMRPQPRVSHHGHTGNTRHSPRNGFNSLFRAPRRPGSFATVALADRLRKNLTPASGRQDPTTSPSASGAFVYSAIVYRIPPHVRDDRETPP